MDGFRNVRYAYSCSCTGEHVHRRVFLLRFYSFDTFRCFFNSLNCKETTSQANENKRSIDLIRRQYHALTKWFRVFTSTITLSLGFADRKMRFYGDRKEINEKIDRLTRRKNTQVTMLILLIIVLPKNIHTYVLTIY